MIQINIGYRKTAAPPPARFDQGVTLPPYVRRGCAYLDPAGQLMSRLVSIEFDANSFSLLWLRYLLKRRTEGLDWRGRVPGEGGKSGEVGEWHCEVMWWARRVVVRGHRVPYCVGNVITTVFPL